MSIPKRVSERIAAGLKRLLPIVLEQKSRDVSEADTVTLVRSIMADGFGFDKYLELTGEFVIRGTFCDIAVRLDDKVTQLIEVKAIGITLTDRHLKQVIDYAANQGVEWVILTNAIDWRLYNVVFAKPIDNRLVAQMNLLEIDPRREGDQELLYLFTKEGFKKGAHVEMRDRQDATSRFLLSALLLNNCAVLSCIRRELRRVVDALVDDTDILRVLRAEVIKRDALEGPEADEAAARVSKAERGAVRSKARGSRKPRAPRKRETLDVSETSVAPTTPCGPGDANGEPFEPDTNGS